MQTTSRIQCMHAALIWLLWGTMCWASSPMPGTAAKLRFELVLQLVQQDSSLASPALEFMKGVAENRAAVLPVQLESQLQLRPNELQSPNYLSDLARAHAFRAIGRLGTPEAIAYLEGVGAEDFTPDDGHEPWQAAQEALQDALLEKIPNWAEKAQVLEAKIRENSAPEGNGYVANWAGERLCNSGMLASYPVVQEFLLQQDSVRGPENARFCELRMRALASSPDRVAALGSILTVTAGLADERLTNWAIDELTEMKSSRADEVMERFEKSVSDLPNGPQKRELKPYANAIRQRNGIRPSRQ